MDRLTRREFVKAMQGGAVLLGGRALPVLSQHHAEARARYVPKFFTREEAATVEAISARIIPSDGTPGAREARVVDFIDHMLATLYAAEREAYRAGLRRLDGLARTARGRPFATLGAAEQDALLARLERREVDAWPGAGDFFAMVRAHTVEGMFCGPSYHGNAGGVGWKLLGA